MSEIKANDNVIWRGQTYTVADITRYARHGDAAALRATDGHYCFNVPLAELAPAAPAKNGKAK